MQILVSQNILRYPQASKCFCLSLSTFAVSGIVHRVVYLLRTYRKNTWVSGIFWVLGVTIEYVPARFLYGYIPDTYIPKGKGN